MTAWCLQGQMVSVDMTRQLQAMGGGGGAENKSRSVQEIRHRGKQKRLLLRGWLVERLFCRQEPTRWMWRLDPTDDFIYKHFTSRKQYGPRGWCFGRVFFLLPETSTPFQDDFCFHCAWLSCRKGLLLKALGSLKNQRPMSDILLRNLNSLIIFSLSYFF